MTATARAMGPAVVLLLLAAPAGAASLVTYNTYWGDLHGHSMDSPVTLDQAAVDGYLAYARDTKALHFAALTEKDFDLSDAEWTLCRARATAFTTSSFVAFSAFEWGDDTYGDFGHRPVYYLSDGQSLFRSDSSSHDHVSELLEDVVGQTNGFTSIAHPDLSNYAADWAYFDGASDRIAEIYSRHGHYETGERGVQQALATGLRFGFVAVSDTRSAQPGDYGLTAVLATSLSKSNLHAALKARRCYATTGARILLRVLADGHEMGEVYTSSTGPTFTVNCTPPGNLERIEVLKNNIVVYVFTPSGFAKPMAATPWRLAPDAIGVDWATSSFDDVSWDELPELRPGRSKVRTVRARRHARVAPGAGAVLQTRLAGPHRIWVNGRLLVDTRALHLEPETRPHDCNAEDAHDLVGSLERAHRLGFYDLRALGVPLVAGDNLIAVEHEPPPGDTAPAGVELMAASPAGAPVSFTWADNAFNGSAFYYVRVTQTDGHQAWSSPIWVDRLAPDTTPPLAPTKLRASKDSDDVYLSWSKVTKDTAGNIETMGMYRIFRATTPAFTPDRVGLTNQIGTTTKSTFRDNNALDAAADYYYRVTAADAANNESPSHSNLAYKMRHPLTFHSGISNIYWLSIPYQTIYTNANGVARDLNGGSSGPVTKVLRWEVATQQPASWAWFGGRWVGTNFSLTPGQAVAVTIDRNVDAVLVGAHEDATTVRLTHNPGAPSLNWVAVPAHSPHQLAFQVVQDINNGYAPSVVTRITRLNPDLQTYQTYQWNGSAWSGTNFVVLPGESFGVEVGTTSDWSPDTVQP
jgi:hypothetical protein